MRLSTLVCLSVVSCAGLRAKPDAEELKPTIEAFHQRARWKDFRGAADLIVPERRAAFIKARMKSNDDKDLFITNFELEDGVVGADGSSEVVTRMSWYRLPSNVEKTSTMTSVFVWREGKWWLESQLDGPFPELAPAPSTARAETADAGR